MDSILLNPPLDLRLGGSHLVLSYFSCKVFFSSSFKIGEMLKREKRNHKISVDEVSVGLCLLSDDEKKNLPQDQ